LGLVDGNNIFCFHDLCFNFVNNTKKAPY